MAARLTRELAHWADRPLQKAPRTIDMSDDLQNRRRRALYRAQHRGTKEMDLVIGGYVAARIAAMDEAHLGLLERLLALPDPDLESWVYARTWVGETELGPLIEDIRQFHGLLPAAG